MNILDQNICRCIYYDRNYWNVKYANKRGIGILFIRRRSMQRISRIISSSFSLFVCGKSLIISPLTSIYNDALNRFLSSWFRRFLIISNPFLFIFSRNIIFGMYFWLIYILRVILLKVFYVSQKMFHPLIPPLCTVVDQDFAIFPTKFQRGHSYT